MGYIVSHKGVHIHGMGYDRSYNRSSTLSSDSIQTNITGPRQSCQSHRTRYKYTLPVLDNLFSLFGFDTNDHYRFSTIFSALSDSIQTCLTSPRQSFQSYRTRYKQPLSVLTILSVLSDSIPTNFTGPRQSFQPYRTQYKQTDECFNERFDERCSRGKRKVFSALFQSIAS